MSTFKFLILKIAVHLVAKNPACNSYIHTTNLFMYFLHLLYWSSAWDIFWYWTEL